MYPLKKLGEISKTTSGGTPLRSSSVFWGGNIPWLKSGELNDNLKISSSEEFITEEGLNNSSAKIFKKGTLLIAMYGATAGKLGILDFDSSTNQAVCSIQNNHGLFIEKYIFYFLLNTREKIIKDSFGGAQPNISKGYLDNLQIPLPPLPTQKAIVQKLDEAFARIDASIELAEKSLKAIEEGNASVLEEVFGSGEYEEKKLGDLVKIIGGGTPSKAKKEYYTGNILWATVGDMNVQTIYDTQLKITEEGLKDSSSNIVSPDGIIIATRVGLGKVCYVSQDTAINQDLKGLIPSNNLDKKYLYRFFQSIEKYILRNGTGATVKGVKLDFVKQIKLPLPPLEKQKEIVEYLDRVFAVHAELRRAYEEKIHSLKELKQSLLREAFEGRLVRE